MKKLLLPFAIISLTIFYSACDKGSILWYTKYMLPGTYTVRICSCTADSASVPVPLGSYDPTGELFKDTIIINNDFTYFQIRHDSSTLLVPPFGINGTVDYIPHQDIIHIDTARVKLVYFGSGSFVFTYPIVFRGRNATLFVELMKH